MLKVAFIGKMQSGKDTACDTLFYRFGGEILAFAKPVYEIEEFIWRTLGLPVPTDKKIRRPILQHIGTDIVRHMIDEDAWCNVLANRLNPTENNYIRDMRFPNEARKAKELGFIIIKIIRPDQERALHATSHVGHESETSIDMIPDELIDATIYNDGSLVSFQEEVIKRVTMLALERMVIDGTGADPK